MQEIKKLRYELCPRVMKERKFWRIYFILVSTHVCLYEKQYMEEVKQRAKQEGANEDEPKQTPGVKTEPSESSLKSKTSSASTEQDLDTFLLGDFEESDGGGGDDGDDGSFGDDFDKIGNSDVEE
ncbi:uncharacterized protein LOC120145108 [Hibiscus syriacus]|uniref:uncharacterized protein LOC120145108 n=1 Tax=Hibiscus syriacus TaxID=106335 RepID=UPI001923CD76|nr:uncharacterized protein LOC120145108 [Hibiscus syriacus]